jgi:hypothetical protein
MNMLGTEEDEGKEGCVIMSIGEDDMPMGEGWSTIISGWKWNTVRG